MKILATFKPFFLLEFSYPLSSSSSHHFPIYQRFVPLFCQSIQCLVPLFSQSIQCLVPLFCQFIQCLVPLFCQFIKRLVLLFCQFIQRLVLLFYNFLQHIMQFSQLIHHVIPISLCQYIVFYKNNPFNEICWDEKSKYHPTRSGTQLLYLVTLKFLKYVSKELLGFESTLYENALCQVPGLETSGFT